METSIFIPDKPITTIKDDQFHRKDFVYKLKDSIIKWEGTESLVLSLKGEWGTGKSSVINLIKEQLLLSPNELSPTIIEFNPWIFSNQENLNFHFFNEISNEIKLKNEKTDDEKIAKKIKLYSELINLNNDSKTITDFISKLIIGVGLIGITFSQFFNWLNLTNATIRIIFFIIGFLLILSQIISASLLKISKLFEIKSLKKGVTVRSLKTEIINDLIKRKKKLLIIIDDIDRLTKNEIKDIFRLIRINADFPNTIYLLAYDNAIVEKYLEEQEGVSGKEYLKKIVQVDFDLPYVKSDELEKYLLIELEEMLQVLPNSINKYFIDKHWSITYHTGYKNLFRSIRDVKRYKNSLLFNINLLHKNDTFEVNPIDFLALEAIRVFAPEFYTFIKERKELFTNKSETDSSSLGLGKVSRKNDLEKGLSFVSETIKPSIKLLTGHLFPNIKSLIIESSVPNKESHSSWSKNQRICSPKHFDAYFTLNPEAKEGELTQYEIDCFLESTNNVKQLEEQINLLIENNKIKLIINRLDDYVDDKDLFDETKTKNLIQVIFNNYELLHIEKEDFTFFSFNFLISRIIQNLLKDWDKEDNYTLLKNCIENSSNIYGPVELLANESELHKKHYSNILLTKERLQNLQSLCVEKINDIISKNIIDFLDNKGFFAIFYKWKEWSNEKDLSTFIIKILSENELTIRFCKGFVNTVHSYSTGAKGKQILKYINFIELGNFIEIEPLIEKLKNLTTKDSFVDYFLNEYETYKNNSDTYLKRIYD